MFSAGYPEVARLKRNVSSRPLKIFEIISLITGVLS